jgi:tellurite methyltransferase
MSLFDDMPALRDQFGDIDIYLFDQLLRGRILPPMRILDAGCGGGRNLVYLLQNGYDVMACDRDPGAVRAVRALASRLAPNLPDENFRVEPVESMTFPPASADLVIVSAVLHFAESDEQFDCMLRSAWRVLGTGGMFFARLASSIGIEDKIQRIDGRRCRLPDGTDRYLVDEPMLTTLTAEFGGELCDPIKTTVVQDQRAMTTWVVRKVR